MSGEGSTFVETIRPFLTACPGPPLAAKGLRIAALQQVDGIPGLDGRDRAPHTHFSRDRRLAGEDRYLRTVREIAERVNWNPRSLSEAARRHGYRYSHALRWIRFLHFLALNAEGCGADQAAYRLGFHDVAGLTRSCRALHGRTLRQLPSVELSLWVRWGIEDVFLDLRSHWPR